MMEIDLELEKIREENKEYNWAMFCIRAVVNNINELADAFDRTGNTTLARELIANSSKLEHANSIIQKHVSDLNHKRWKETEQGTLNMITAVMAVMDVKAGK